MQMAIIFKRSFPCFNEFHWQGNKKSLSAGRETETDGNKAKVTAKVGDMYLSSFPPLWHCGSPR